MKKLDRAGVLRVAWLEDRTGTNGRFATLLVIFELLRPEIVSRRGVRDVDCGSISIRSWLPTSEFTAHLGTADDCPDGLLGIGGRREIRYSCRGLAPTGRQRSIGNRLHAANGVPSR